MTQRTQRTQPTEWSKGRRWLGFLIGGVLIISFGFVLLVLLEMLVDLSPLQHGACALAIIIAVNLWGRRFGITK